MPVLFGEEDIGLRKFPVNFQGGVIPEDGTFAPGGVVIVALILKNGLGRQYGEAVCKPSWDEQLPMILSGQFNGDMLSESRGTAADIHGNVKHPAVDNSHKLALRVFPFLEMKSPKNSIAAHALVVLHKMHA